MPSDSQELLDLVRQLRADVLSLQQRIEVLESGAAESAALSAGPHSAGASAAPAKAAIDEETVLVIASALAAFLGVKPHIRQIRLIRSGSWAHQGRATIHASHLLP
jgi:methylmalonyl-CoA carboxyltransferase 12S subunit